MVAAADSGEAAAKEQVDALIYDHRNSDGTLTGAGPFRIAEWEPGKHLDACSQRRLTAADGPLWTR